MWNFKKRLLNLKSEVLSVACPVLRIKFLSATRMYHVAAAGHGIQEVFHTTIGLGRCASPI